jgi:peptidoglycan/xylan/chitin deacetylase (PgdA/CDA1 family)
MLWLFGIIGALLLSHVAPFPFLLDVTDETVWSMPDNDPPTVYLTFDDGPNPTATPQVLDTLRRHGVSGTFFVIDRHINADTVPILRRTFEEGHAVGLHSDSRRLTYVGPNEVARTLQAAAARIETLTGHQPCRAFRPHAGNRSVTMLIGARRADYSIVGWGWMLWDVNWFRERSAGVLVDRFMTRASAGDIIVIHDGHHRNSRANRRYAVETVDRLIPALKARGFRFGRICP